jgi:hypothetical protein
MGRLQAEHHEFGRLFARHQEALLERRWAQAAGLLAQYTRGLARHIEFEERYVLPRCGRIGLPRWASGVYAAEHRRILLLLRNAADRLTEARRDPISAARIIALLDAEKPLKHLLEHHHEREESALFVEVCGGDWQAGAMEAPADTCDPHRDERCSAPPR